MTLPFENDTKQIEKTLAKRSLDADRRRNLVAVVTIGLAVCLMGLFAFIYTATNARTIAQLRGQYQSGCNQLSYADIERLTSSGKLDSWGYQSDSHQIRYMDANLSVQFFDRGMLVLMRIDPMTGKYPQEKNEICVERAFLKYFGLPEEIGQSVSLNLGDGEKTYLVSGILEKENDSRQFDVYISEELAAAQGGEKPFTLRFRFMGSDIKQPEQLRADIKAFYQEMGISEEHTFYSSTYFDLSDIYLGSDLSVYGVALLMAIVCAVVIYNIFYISVMSKLREYGRLKVIGATPRQLCRVVRRERRILMCISIPLGLVIAALLTILLYPGYWNWAGNLKYSIFIVVLTILVVVFSTHKPLQLAGKVSAIEAVRSNAYTYQAMPGMSRALHRPLSVARLAFMNFTRNRVKTALTLASLGLTGILTACIASYASSVNVEELARSSFGDGGEYTVGIEDDSEYLPEAQKEGILGADVREQLLALQDVDFITAWSSVYCKIAQSPNPNSIYLVGGFTKAQMAAYQEKHAVQEGTADYETLLQNDGIMITRDGENLLKKLYHLDLSIGDTVTLKSQSGYAKDYTVMGIAEAMKGTGTAKLLVLPEEELRTLYPEIEDFTAFINVHTTRVSDQQRRALYGLLDDPRISIDALPDRVAQMQTSLQGMLVLLYGLVVFIALFALINLLNTLMTNLLTRRQELGILQSVGMTGRQLTRMISTECLCYVVATLLITFSVGTACGIGVVQVFNQLGLFGQLTYHFPIMALLIFAGALFIVYGVFSLFAVRYLQKQTLVERIMTVD